MRGQPAGGLHTVNAGHADVHQHHIGTQPVRQLDRRQTVGGLTDDLQVGLGRTRRMRTGAGYAGG